VLILEGFFAIMVSMVTRFDIPWTESGSLLTNEERREICVRMFYQKFPTKDDCTNELFARFCPDGGRCKCGSRNITRESGARSFSCNNCGAFTWFTAGTMFHQVKKLQPHMLYDTLLENRISVSSAEFSRITGVDPKTARDIFGKFTTVIERNLMVKNAVLAFSRIFIACFLRRSFVTPAYEHPRAEEEAMQKMEGQDQGPTSAGAENISHAPRAGPNTALSAAFDAKSSGDSGQLLSPLDGGRECEVIAAALERAAQLAEDNAGTLREIYALLTDDGINLEKIIQKTGVAVGVASACIVYLELNQLAKGTGGDWYSKDVPDEVKAKATSAKTKKDRHSVGLPASVRFPVSNRTTEAFELTASIKPTIELNGSIESADRAALTERAESNQATNLTESTEFIDSALQAFLEFVRTTFVGISRKYLQKYLAYWWYIRHPGEHPALLIDECLRFGKIGKGMPRSYNTPLIVRLAA
jgi:hypothetical protein